MGSNYFGEANLRNERYGGGGGGGGGSSSSSSSSSRKGKKKSGNNSDKPKQPQRGLGVAQLEKIRLDTQMAVAAAAYNINSDSLNPIYFPNPQEDIRVERPYISSSSSPSSLYTSTMPSLSCYGFDAPQTIKMMGMQGKTETETTYVSYCDSQPSLNTRWNAGKTVPGIQHSQQSQLLTRQLLDLEAEEATGTNKKARCDSVESGSAVSGSSNNEELDLELRLSL